MHTQLEDWKTAGNSPSPQKEIGTLIECLQMLKAEPDQHFHLTSTSPAPHQHLTSTYQGSGGIGDIAIYVQDPSEPDNMESIGSKALPHGQEISS